MRVWVRLPLPPLRAFLRLPAWLSWLVVLLVFSFWSFVFACWLLIQMVYALVQAFRAGAHSHQRAEERTSR